jgi:hypothetical protein
VRGVGMRLRMGFWRRQDEIGKHWKGIYIS